ncbi:MAG: leucine-rich repeat protein [Clostridia bacterium]|nr:leucine-rich repeat protein [Clostridia bacterium]
MKLLSCQICGGELKQNGDHYECAYCRHQFQDDTLERAYHDLKNSLESVTRSAVDEAFVLAKERELANLRRELWARTHERYVNSRAITRICRDIKKINPEDFGARFYEVMNDESEETRLVTEFLDGIDVFEKEDYVDDVVDFVVKSLKIEYLPSLNMLVERAYKTDKAKYEAVMTKIEDEAEKVEGGLYETQLSRDVFVAYSSKDIAIVNELVSYLETQGVSCFVALRNLQHGRKAVENYEKALETAMDNCRIFLFVSSKNSRSLTCDAVKREIPYIKKKDLEFKPEYRNNYEKMPERYRKPRIQYRIDDVKTAIVDRQISEFFGTLQWRCDLDSVAEQIGEYLNQEFDDEPIERKEEPQAPQPQQPAFDQKALYEVFKQIRNEEELERKAEEKRKEEIRLADFEIENGVLKKYKGAGGEVVIPSDVSTIGEYAFELCERLTGVTIPPSVTNIRTGAFSYCTELKRVELSSGVREIEDYAFNKCEKLLKMEIPSNVKSIGDGAFKDCSNLARVTIPFNVAKMGHAVFQGCSSVTVYAEAKAQPSGWESSWNPNNRPVVWGNSGGEIPKTVSVENPDFEIENGVLKKYNGAGGAVVIPNGVTGIWASVFKDCIDLTSVTIPNNVTVIGQYAFAECSGLTNITIPNSITMIGDGVFKDCSGLTSVTIPKNVTMIGDHAFRGCSGLTRVTIPDRVKGVGSSAFEGCSGLTSVTIPNNVMDIGNSAFAGCSGLTSVMIPKSVTMIWSGAFAGCSSLKIYAEASSKPSGWIEGWNPLNRPVVWGHNANIGSANANKSKSECPVCGSELFNLGNDYKCYGCGNWFTKSTPSNSNQATTKSEPKPVEKKVEKVNVPTETVHIHLKHSSSPLSPANGSPYLIKIDDKISTKVVTAKTDTFGKVEVPIGRHILTVALFAYGDPDCRGNAIWKSNAQSIVIEKGKSYVIEITPYKFLGSPKIDVITK